MNLYDRVKDLCNERGISIRQLEIRLGIGNGIIARWKTSIPNSERLDKVAEFFGVSTDYLLGKKPKEEFITFYDKDIARMAQEIKDRPELRVLFDASQKLSKDDLEFVVNMIERMK